ncbi:hypothetical protein JJJ17_05610 [Paracoccus caeni]|uniref:Lipoprotein n=1 Tax=Paracoccus caeni TaxID=657651 RepID=A0A934W025_9RHOB|nr:hypothetical protein [Paracoccus caeni]
MSEGRFIAKVAGRTSYLVAAIALFFVFSLTGCTASSETDPYYNAETAAKKFDYHGQTYLVELVEIEGHVSEMVVATLYQMALVSRAEGQFEDTPADRAEAEAVARAYCASLPSFEVKTPPAPNRVDGPYYSFIGLEAGFENAEWRFADICTRSDGEPA